MKIIRKLYAVMLVAAVGLSFTGCNKVENKINTEVIQQQNMEILSNTYYVVDNKLNYMDINSGEIREVEANVDNWIVIGNKIYYTTASEYQVELSEEEMLLSQNEVYVMDLDGKNKQKVLGKEDIKKVDNQQEDYRLYYTLLGKDEENLYFAMKQAWVGTEWSNSVVYRMNINNNEVECVSDIQYGPMYYFNVANDRFYYTILQPGDECGSVIEVDCTTKESKVLTEYGRSLGAYNNESYYLDMSKVDDVFYNKLIQVVKVNSETGLSEEKYKLYDIQSEMENNTSHNPYYMMDMQVKQQYLEVTLTTSLGYGGNKVTKKVYDLTSNVGYASEEYNRSISNEVLGQKDGKIYYLEEIEDDYRKNLVCMDTLENTKEILAEEISAYTTDILWEQAQSVEKNLQRSLAKAQGDDIIIYESGGALYSISTSGGEPLRLFELNDTSQWEVLKSFDGRDYIYFTKGSGRYKGTIDGTEFETGYSNDLAGEWRIKEDIVTGEKWVLSQYSDGQAVFSNVSKMIDVKPMRNNLDLENVKVVNNKFIYSNTYTDTGFAENKSIYMCDLEGNEEMLIAYPEHLISNHTNVTTLSVLEVQGKDVYYTIDYDFGEQGEREIYRYDTEKQESTFIYSVDLPYRIGVGVEIKGENLIVKYVGHGYSSVEIIDLQTAQVIERYEDEESSMRTIDQQDEKGNSYYVDYYQDENFVMPIKTIVKVNEQGEEEVIFETRNTLASQIRFISKGEK